jgi:hypothetical protein
MLAGMNYIQVEAAGKTTEQQGLDQVMEMMKGQGMDPKQMEQMENLLKNMSQMETQQKAARVNKEQQAFEAETAGYGTARVEVEGKQYELKVTQCEVRDSQRGAFMIKARQAPGMDEGELSVHSDGPNLQNTFQFYTRSTTSKNYSSGSTAFEFDGKTLTWEGVVESNSKKVPLTLNISCGAEAVYYDKPSRPRPDTPNNVLTLYIGDETYEFEASRCSMNAYRTGNLMVDFETTTTGTFRGRPAIALLTKSHGVGPEGASAGYFHNFDLLLGELSAEQRKLSPLEVKKQLQDVAGAYQQKAHLAHQEKYKNVKWDSMPPDKMNEAMEASQAEYSRIMEKVKTMRYPEAASRGGVVTIKGQDVLFRGPALSPNDADHATEFGDLSATPEVFVSCGT